jgi:membrane protein YdbS with pleckstrin-like domain
VVCVAGARGGVLSVAVASFQPAAVVYREEQNFDWWVYALLGGVEALVVFTLYWLHANGHDPALGGTLNQLALALFAVAGLGLPPLVVVGRLRMTTEVTPADVRVWFGWVPTYRRVVPIGSVQKIEVVSYRPLADHGGWGICSGRDGERVLSARGDRGVRLELTDGTRLLIGSQRPESLALAIEGALRPGV